MGLWQTRPFPVREHSEEEELSPGFAPAFALCASISPASSIASIAASLAVPFPRRPQALRIAATPRVHARGILRGDDPWRLIAKVPLKSITHFPYLQCSAAGIS